MSLRRRLILSAITLAIACFAGTYIILSNINSLVRNQNLLTFKDNIFHDHQIAQTLIESAQAKLYQHKAGYSRDIDELVNDVYTFESLLRSIPAAYHTHTRPRYCNTCHDDVNEDLRHLTDRIGSLVTTVDKYKELLSLLITTSDPKAQLVIHGNANAIGEGIIETISEVNRSAGLMIVDLLGSNRKLVTRTAVTITIVIAAILVFILGVMAYLLFAFHRMFSSLIRGTESIYRDDFSTRLAMTNRRDEFSLLASRFNLMAEHLQERDKEIRIKTDEVAEVNQQLRDLNENLEVKIKERTTELEDMVDQLRHTSAALEESKRRLETANIDLIKANQAKSNFLSIVSHELKTPLSVINGFLSLILDERYQNDPKNLREAVEISKRRGQQLARMIDELIDLSRLDARAMVIHKVPVAIGDAVRDAVEQFQQDLERKQIHFSVSGCGSLSTVYCDSDKFKQIVTNLMSNAVKFSPEGSTIAFTCREEGDEFVFLCRDEGIGLPPSEREKIFEKFYQVDSSATRRFGGAGLGLSIVKEIVHLHGGRVWVESEEGSGCTFFFTIPKSPGEAGRESEKYTAAFPLRNLSARSGMRDE